MEFITASCVQRWLVPGSDLSTSNSRHPEPHTMPRAGSSMRSTAITAVLSSILVAAACGRSSRPAASTESSASQAHAPSAATTPASGMPPGNVGELAGALGLAVGTRIPDGLTPGGDCPPAASDTAQEITAQAAAPVPLKQGLTLAYEWMRTPQEEYECLIQVTTIEPDGINTTASCNVPGGEDLLPRRVCRSDLRSAHMLHTVYGAVKVLSASGEPEPETIVGATAFSLSSAEFAQLKQNGSFTHHYVELGDNGQLAKDGTGELRADGRAMMAVVVNDRPVDLPVIRTRGRLKWWIRGQELETEDVAIVLDDEHFPLLIDQQSSNDATGSRIRFAKISYPSEGGGDIEGGLLRKKRVDVYGIYFDFNSDRIRVESEPVLKEIGELMKRHADWRLAIDGHTDNVGGDGEANLALSRRRSEAVRTALVNRFGVSAARLTSGGHGAAAPKDTNDTPEGRARNRRVELVLQ
jgi:outer membrane protein OmpA-like peptidoglycan-associated protein